MAVKIAGLSLIFCILFAEGISPAKLLGDNTFHINITVKSNNHEAIIKSHLRRELRQLGDVKIGYGKKGHELAVVHIHDGGFHFCSVIARLRLAPEFLINDKAIREVHQDSCSIMSHFLITHERDIAQMCEGIISKIDADVFEPVREMRYLLNDIQNKLKD